MVTHASRTECSRIVSGRALFVLVIAAASGGGLTGCTDADVSPDANLRLGADTDSARILTLGEWPEPIRLSGWARLFPEDPVDSEVTLFDVVDLLPRVGGGVHVADAGSQRILTLNERGGLLWNAGRRGEGPAEFRALGKLHSWPGDTLVALDGRENRASFWTRSGEHARVVRGGAAVSEPAPNLLLSVPGAVIGSLRDGDLVIRGPQHVSGRGEPGLRRTRTHITLVTTDGSQRTAFSLPGPWAYELGTPGRRPALAAPMSGGTAVDLLQGFEAHDLVWARADTFEVHLLDRDGTSGLVFRVEEPREAVTSPIREAYLEEWSPWFAVDEEIPFPARVPAFDRVFATPTGEVWARRYHWGSAGEEWLHIAVDAGLATRFRFPPRVEIMGATSHRAYGIHRDELDVESVVRFDLPEGGAARFREVR